MNLNHFSICTSKEQEESKMYLNEDLGIYLARTKLNLKT